MARSKLSGEQWATIQAQYEGGGNVNALAEKYGIKPNTISQRAKRKGWAKHGEVKAEAVEEAKSAVTEKLKSTYMAEYERHLKNATQIYRVMQAIATKQLKIGMVEHDKLLKGEKLTTEEMAVLATLRSRTYQMNVASQMANMGILGERIVNGYDNIKPEVERDGIDDLRDSVFNKLRKERGLPIDHEALTGESADIPDTEIDLEVGDV
jgi:transposase-like protein